MTNYVGIDVGKLSLEFYLPINHKNHQISNNAQGFSNLLEYLSKHYQLSDVMLVFEPTGGYEKELEKYCIDKDIKYIKVHPSKARHYAKAIGLLAKTDKIDCKLLSDYALHFNLQPQPINYNSHSQQKLVSLIKRRNQLMVMENQEYSRLETESDDTITESIEAHIRYLQQETKLIHQQVTAFCKEDKEIYDKISKLTSIPGVGNILAIATICHAPELGHIPINKLTSLIGLAPFARESGSYKGRRSIFGGRAYLRKILYMASVASLRVNKTLKDFYDRLIANHKPAKLALVAVMRKLLAIMHSIIKNDSHWLNPTISS